MQNNEPVNWLVSQVTNLVFTVKLFTLHLILIQYYHPIISNLTSVKVQYTEVNLETLGSIDFTLIQ